MAEGKKSFILYSEIIHTVEHLPDELAGQLFKHILAYVNDKNPVSDNMVLNIAFEPIKRQLKRDLDRWEELRTKRSDAGKRSAKSRKAEQRSTKSTSVNTCSTKSTRVKFVDVCLTHLTVNVNANVNVNVSLRDSIESAVAFYASQIKSSGGLKSFEKYKSFVEFIFQRNPTNEPLTNVLKMPKQITFTQFTKLIAKADLKRESLPDMLLSLDNVKQYHHGKKDVYLTLNNWLNRK